MSELNPRKCLGMDGIHPYVITECSTIFSENLNHIFRKSFDEGCVPDHWKNAHVAAVLKKVSRSDLYSYRPVSLAAIEIGIFEKKFANFDFVKSQ